MNVILTSEARKDLEMRCTIALEILRSAQDDGA
jgi:hypothetical protein